jgi:pimeloyl-ACP methyl ester carboxylesterase
VRVDVPLAPNEHVLPIAYDPDSELFLPLGRAKRTGGGIEIEIQRLPEPSAGSRSLLGSIKIFFEKVFTEKRGAEFRYPLLGAIDVSGNSTTDPDEVRKRVAKAKSVLLYVHGIIGDTKAMAASAFAPEPARQAPLPALGQRYDLVLTFDYENINTSIEENARALKKRLEQAGLGAGHGKMLHIAAHSMGGLISRWFIEREGGNAIVQHLVMLGTPNAGSPWPTIQDWATAAIGLGLNALTTVAWPAKVLGGLVASVEKIDIALDQMAPGSEFLKSLAASADPKIPYTVLAGNTSIISAAMQPERGKTKSRIARLFEKLSLQRVLHVTTSLAFFGNPNDVAVSVESISNLPKNRSPKPIVQPIACDHMTYFATEAGLEALDKALE